MKNRGEGGMVNQESDEDSFSACPDPVGEEHHDDRPVPTLSGRFRPCRKHSPFIPRRCMALLASREWRSEEPHFVLTSLLSYTLTSLLLNDHATSQPYHELASPSAAAPPSSYHPRRQNTRRRFPLLRRAAAFRWDCRTLRKFSGHRLSQICNRPPGQTTLRARTQEVLERPPAHRASPRSPCATHPAGQSAFRSRAGVHPHRAARRRISPLPFRSSRFSPPAGHNRNCRTTPHPSTRDKRFGSSSPRSRHSHQQTGSVLRDRPCRRTWPSGCTSSSRCGSCRPFARDIHSRALRPSPSSRCPRRIYVLPCWGRENPRDSRSRTPRDEAPFPARRSRWHPRASDDTRAASCPPVLPKLDPAAAAFSCGWYAPANSSGPRGE